MLVHDVPGGPIVARVSLNEFGIVSSNITTADSFLFKSTGRKMRERFEVARFDAKKRREYKAGKWKC